MREVGIEKKLPKALWTQEQKLIIHKNSWEVYQ